MPLIVTEPYFNFSTIQEGMTEMFFEEYEFQALLRTNGKLSLLDLLYKFAHLIYKTLYFSSWIFILLPLLP